MLNVFLFLQCGRKERVSSSIMWVQFFCNFFFLFILFVHVTLACYRWHQNMWILITVFCLCVCVFVARNFEAQIQLLLHHLPGWQHSQPAQPQIHHQMVITPERKHLYFFIKPTCFSDININISFCLQCSIGNILPYKKQVRILMLPKDCQLISGHLISRTIYSVYPKI